jgi:hypothetical protein
MWVQLYRSETGEPGTFKLVATNRAYPIPPKGGGQKEARVWIGEFVDVLLYRSIQLNAKSWVMVAERGADLSAEVRALIREPGQRGRREPQ